MPGPYEPPPMRHMSMRPARWMPWEKVSRVSSVPAARAPATKALSMSHCWPARPAWIDSTGGPLRAMASRQACKAAFGVPPDRVVVTARAPS